MAATWHPCSPTQRVADFVRDRRRAASGGGRTAPPRSRSGSWTQERLTPRRGSRAQRRLGPGGSRAPRLDLEGTTSRTNGHGRFRRRGTPGRISPTAATAWTRASAPTRTRLLLRTRCERAVRARADDRHRGRKRAQTGGHRRTSLDRPKRGRANPSPRRDLIRHARALRGRRAADVRRNAIQLLDIGVLPDTPMVVLNPQPAPRRARRDYLVGLPTTWVIARIAARAT